MGGRHGGFRRIFADHLTGELFADTSPVFGAEEETMYGTEFQYGYAPYPAYDQLGASYEQGAWDGAFGQARYPVPQRVPMAPAGYPQRAPQQQRPQRSPQSAQGKWQKTAIFGQVTMAGVVGVAPAQVLIRPQHDFVAVDCTFDGGTAAGWSITSIIFGDHIVFQVQAPGIPAAVFGVIGFVRGIVKGAKIRGGLDITVNGTVTGNGTANATIFGLKPQRTCL